ncbi:metallophosphoesterase family protein [Acinetobacter tianfuensis]|uniref:3',5'-cyclic-nucleotide phosphodiesterase n=1 Tax=Acinetobacter tianfuensis TaxID=2419603 RepID=A0A3A8EH65_9GAMM|nr:metallophosphoesterase [Acinetobacter tianfuensis]RKG32816.1 3',5'-cyclic-nucleotide phosphodiesterase [Acinetobacter tianfuensis]
MLLHLSDLHFGTEKIACVQALQQFCLEHRPEAVAVSGDLTQRAKFQQFYACKQFLDSLNIPYLAVPGNHDIPLLHLWHRFINPFTRYRLFFGNMESTLETAHFFVAGVNSIRRRYHTRGHISLEQIATVDQVLRHAPANKIKLIAAHQPFYTPPDHEHGVKDCPVLGKIALEAWSQSGLNGLLHGHLHHAGAYDLNQIYMLGAGQPVLDIHAGTATSYRLHHGLPNSFNVIHTDGAVEQYIFHEIDKRFHSAGEITVQS